MDTTKNKDKIILHLCADIGSDSKPYRDAGYDVRLVGRDIGVENYRPPKNVYGIIANPPCTMFSVARSNAKTPRDFVEGMRLVKECLRIIWECQYPTVGHFSKSNLKFWVIENPGSGALKNFLGTPPYSYSPHEFGADYSKQTSLWGLFNQPKKKFPNAPKPKGMHVNNLISPMTHRDPYDRMNARSMCYPDFAQAFFEANP